MIQIEKGITEIGFKLLLNESEKIKIKFALSAVSTEGALKNLKAEVPHFNFEKVKAEAKAKNKHQVQS